MQKRKNAFIDKRKPNGNKKITFTGQKLAFEAVRVTEIAAIASSFHMGRGMRGS